ncbi:MAG: T9SS type A sorting domain-containing protein, partial [Candidatus Marinimicrobia bacterium]|nr:T9SS type A sorting domain-containing protein [Candidatus Neomarinimicrobiota bacterium]
NCRSEDLTVICTHPDLAVEKPPEMSPEHPDVGERFTVYAVIKNIGDKESTPTTVKWFLDEDMIATVELGVLSPEESKEVGADAVLNESRKGKLKVIVDPVDGEINTDNNSKDTLIEVSIDEEDIVAPDETTLYSNYPNPFNTSTLIKYYLKKAEKITLTIYDIKGNKVYEYKPGRQDKGFHAFVWDGRSSKGESVVSGIYFYVFRYGNNWKMKRMLYIK